MKRTLLLTALLVLAVIVVGAEPQQEQSAFPTQSINVVVHSAAGGGSDVWARKVSALMEKDLGVKMVVSNKPGGSGGLAANYVWNQPHDGYTLIGASETSMTYAVNGAFPQSIKVWDYYISGGSPGVICVLKDSPFRSFGDMVAAARAKPETVKVSHSGIGKLWGMKVEMFRKYGNVPVQHAPFNGSAPAIVSLLSKEVDAVSCSAGEATQYIESGEMRPLVMTEKDPFEFRGYGKVPAITDSIPELARYLPMSQFLCLMVPRDAPQAARDRLGQAFEYAMGTPEMAEFIEKECATRYGIWGEAAHEMAVDMEKKFSWFNQELGITKVSPDTLGIGKP